MDPDHARMIGKELQVSVSSTDRSLYFHGNSMLPFLQEGDMVVVRPVAWADLSRGDIVTYRNGEKFTTRRIFSKQADRLTLYCDGWKYLHFYAHRDDILGRAEARLRGDLWITMSDPEWRRTARRSLLHAWWRSLRGRFRPATGPIQ
jgi:signal peptidase I